LSLDVNDVWCDDHVEVAHLEAHGVRVELAHVGAAVFQLGVS
jgi:hypothetical protein